MHRLAIFSLVVFSLIYIAGCGGGGGGGGGSDVSSFELNLSSRTSTNPSPVTLSWTVSGISGISQFRIERKTMLEQAFSTYATVPASQRTYVDNLTLNLRFLDIEYRVSALDSSGNVIRVAGPLTSIGPTPPPPGS